MKIAILGGSFNPIHNGHLRIVKTILKSEIVDSIWLLPAANHPLKSEKLQLDFHVRIKLAKKAVKSIKNCQVYDYDCQDDKPSYSADLLRKLMIKFPNDQFFFIIGFDIIPELCKWYDFNWLSENVQFIIINRPGNYDLSRMKLLKNYNVIQMEPLNVSSSQIRDMLKCSKDVSDLVPEGILDEVTKLYS